MHRMEQPDVVVEVAVDSIAGALAAEQAGAHRIELCAALELGGVTPGAGLLAAVKDRVRIPVFVIVRPRCGDFLYDEGEFTAMEHEVVHARELGADGVVIGILRRDGTLDTERMARLVALAKPMAVTCHRAFDMCVDQRAALEQLVALGIERVLTSGGQKTARQGAMQVAALAEQAAGRITVMAGAGVCSDHVAELVKRTRVREVHLSAAALAPSAMSWRNPFVSMGGAAQPSEYEQRRTDGAEVARVVAAVRAGR